MSNVEARSSFGVQYLAVTTEHGKVGPSDRIAEHTLDMRASIATDDSGLTGDMRPGSDFRSTIALFGTFYPESGMAGNSSTGLAAGIAANASVASVVVFSQFGAELPKGTPWSKVSLVPCWKHDEVTSLIRALRFLLANSHRVDRYLFNTYVTAFGRSAAANAIGLLLPVFVRLLTRKQVTVYMHNFLETQDIARLGYYPSVLRRVGVRFLERLLLRFTTVIVPLGSQESVISEVLHGNVISLFLPFIEPFGLAASSLPPVEELHSPTSGPAKILLLGKWGPQKDLLGVLEALLAARQQGGAFLVTVTEAVNQNFTMYNLELNQAKRTISGDWLTFFGVVPEAELLSLVQSHDIVILPYNATGGYSGAMNLAAYCGLAIIAYDLPQLRETATRLEVQPVFVTKGDTPSLSQEVLSLSRQIQDLRQRRRRLPRYELDSRVHEAVEQLMKIMGVRSLGPRLPDPSE